jgi:Ca2+-binding EF-hand superfamily protein
MKITPLLIVAALAMPLAHAAPGKKAKSGKVVVFTQLFEEADTDDNGILDFEEFSNSYGASERPVVTLFRFNQLSGRWLDNRGIIKIGRGVYLSDFIESNGGRKINPDKTEMFFTADTYRDGFLSPDEFFATRIQSASSRASSMKAFEKLDKNDDGRLSPAEFGANIKV